MERSELENLYHTYYRSLYLYALSLTKSQADAQDLVADTFVKAWLSYKEKYGNILKWMMIVLKNNFIDQYRRQKKLIPDGENVLAWVQDSYDAFAEYMKGERQRFIYEQIYALPKPQQDIMLLSAVTDFSDKEIAEVLNLSVNNVRVLRHRTREKLTELAKKEGYL